MRMVGLRAAASVHARAHTTSTGRSGGQPEPAGLVRVAPYPGHGPAARVLDAIMHALGETATVAVPVTYGNTPNEYLGTWRCWSPLRHGHSPFPQARGPSAGRRGEYPSEEASDQRNGFASRRKESVTDATGCTYRFSDLPLQATDCTVSTHRLTPHHVDHSGHVHMPRMRRRTASGRKRIAWPRLPSINHV